LTNDQTPQGYVTLRNKLKATGHTPQQTLVVMEATSTYWIMLAVELHEAGYAVSVVNPAQAHHFARAQLKRAKTDELDAQTLAHLAQTLSPAPWTPPPAIYHELQQRLSQRDTLQNLRTQSLNRLHALAHRRVVIASVQQREEQLLATLDSQLRSVEAELKEVLAQDTEWAASITLLQSIGGIGLITAAWLVVGTLNFTTCQSVDALTSYVGLAPMPRQSGTSVRGRPSIGHGGNARLRSALYMATLSAVRYNPQIRTFYERLRAAGKSVKVARCACARKLLHIAWAIVKHRHTFDPFYQPKQPKQPKPPTPHEPLVA
jgi:transposase